MRKVLLVLLILAAQGCGRAFVPPTLKPLTGDFWWSYLASYEDVPSSTIVNLALKDRAPLADTHLLITGVSYQSPPARLGLPDDAELEVLNRLGAKRLSLLTSLTAPAPILAGTFTRKNERVDYLYVADSANLEVALGDFYRRECPSRTPSITFKSDPKWEAYFDFLYPNAQTIRHYREELSKLGVL